MTKQKKKTRSIKLGKADKAIAPPARSDRERVKRMTVSHSHALAASILKAQMFKIGGDGCDVGVMAEDFATGVLFSVKPQDALEEMLVAQMIATRGRILFLNAFAHQQVSNVKWASMYHEAADRAAGVFRRQMLSLHEYRRAGRREPVPSVQIAQANIAHQQVIQNGECRNAQKASNEQGSTAGTVAGRSRDAAGLSDDQQGARFIASRRSPYAALEAKHGTHNGGGQGTICVKRVKTRRTICDGHSSTS